jgi:predicted O-linked N-acetylglucosamine transferase (SPINDLY family)
MLAGIFRSLLKGRAEDRDSAEAFAAWQRGDSGEAELHFRRAIASGRDGADVLHGFGSVLVKLGKLDEGVQALQLAVEREPRNAGYQLALGTALAAANQDPVDAIAHLREATRLAPDVVGIEAYLYSQVTAICDWDAGEGAVAHIVARAQREPPELWTQRVFPFDTLFMPVAPELRREVARHFAARIAARAGAPGRPPLAPRGERLRIGYASADFRNHATAHLAAGLFERHDRARFEVVGYSFGRDDGSDYRRRVAGAFDRFVDVQALGAGEAAGRIAEDRIDILVDLMGYTQHSRPAIFAHRPAPLQVSYLGYPGSLHAPFIDYVVADRTVIPPPDRGWFGEAVVWMPGSYQVNDDRQRMEAVPPTRPACGLPEDAFVFCSFNQTRKLERPMFAAWMRILAVTPGSVLWILAGHPRAQANLRSAAASAGVDPERLVFAEVVDKAAHLSRHRLADLFLDTHTCSAHTTASDALWAGLPVLTWPGDSFAGRVSASLLKAIGLPELIVASLRDYEQTAIALARDDQRLRALRARLEANRVTMPLFDTTGFTRQLERAFEEMCARGLRGAPPAGFAVK